MLKKVILIVFVLAVAFSDASASRNSGTRINFLNKLLAQRFKKRDDTGTCVAVECRAEGEACSEEGTRCPIGTHCKNGVCTTYTLGDECSPDSDDDLDYSFGFYCDKTTRKLVESMKKGENCSNYDCGYNLFCESETKTCHSFPRKVGDKCNRNVCPQGMECIASICQIPSVGIKCNKMYGCGDSTLFCSETETCAKIPVKGEQCIEGYCFEGWCNDNNVCVDYPGDGEACYNNYRCKNGFSCANVGTDRKCIKETAGKGEYCTENSDNPVLCKDGLHCNEEKCVECMHEEHCKRNKAK